MKISCQFTFGLSLVLASTASGWNWSSWNAPATEIDLTNELRIKLELDLDGHHPKFMPYMYISIPDYGAELAQTEAKRKRLSKIKSELEGPTAPRPKGPTGSTLDGGLKLMEDEKYHYVDSGNNRKNFEVDTDRAIEKDNSCWEKVAEISVGYIAVWHPKSLVTYYRVTKGSWLGGLNFQKLSVKTVTYRNEPLQSARQLLLSRCFRLQLVEWYDNVALLNVVRYEHGISHFVDSVFKDTETACADLVELRLHKDVLFASHPAKLTDYVIFDYDLDKPYKEIMEMMYRSWSGFELMNLTSSINSQCVYSAFEVTNNYGKLQFKLLFQNEGTIRSYRSVQLKITSSVHEQYFHLVRLFTNGVCKRTRKFVYVTCKGVTDMGWLDTAVTYKELELIKGVLDNDIQTNHKIKYDLFAKFDEWQVKEAFSDTEIDNWSLSVERLTDSEEFVRKWVFRQAKRDQENDPKTLNKLHARLRGLLDTRAELITKRTKILQERKKLARKHPAYYALTARFVYQRHDHESYMSCANKRYDENKKCQDPCWV